MEQAGCEFPCEAPTKPSLGYSRQGRGAAGQMPAFTLPLNQPSHGALVSSPEARALFLDIQVLLFALLITHHYSFPCLLSARQRFSAHQTVPVLCQEGNLPHLQQAKHPAPCAEQPARLWGYTHVDEAACAQLISACPMLGWVREAPQGNNLSSDFLGTHHALHPNRSSASPCSSKTGSCESQTLKWTCNFPLN